jgi:hypothetical protein
VLKGTPEAEESLESLRGFCEEHHPNHYEIEVVDLSEASSANAKGKVTVAATVMRISPEPVVSVVGNLNDWNLLRATLLPPLA